MTRADGLALYTRVAGDSAGVVIRGYSTSFSAASRLLAAPVRRRVGAVYALVRLADEIVDGASADAGLTPEQAGRLLDAMEAETDAAIACGYSTNLVIHAFASVARTVGFGAELTAPFFAAMRADLTVTRHDADSLRAYVHGSAEVVGLMCLAVFLHGHDVPGPARRVMADGARRLGAAFQLVNFLRDVGADEDRLGRHYLTAGDGRFGEAVKHAVLDEVEENLRIAVATIPLLPAGSRSAVAAAAAIFAELSRRLRAMPAAAVRSGRVSVPAPVKLWLVGAALVEARRGSWTGGAR